MTGATALIIPNIHIIGSGLRTPISTVFMMFFHSAKLVGEPRCRSGDQIWKKSNPRFSLRTTTTSF
jgi:hypothetical protein